jgi:hypothetical protein
VNRPLFNSFTMTGYILRDLLTSRRVPFSKMKTKISKFSTKYFLIAQNSYFSRGWEYRLSHSSRFRMWFQRVKPSAQCSTLLSGGGYLQQRDDSTPNAARISESTAIPHTAPPAKSASGSPGLGCNVIIAAKPAQVRKLNTLSMM